MRKNLPLNKNDRPDQSHFSTYNWVNLIIMTLGIVIISCSKDDDMLPIPEVMFANTELSIQENSTDELNVSLSFTRALEEPGTVVISIDNGSTATNADYTTNPSGSSGTITLSLPKDATSATFTVTPEDNSNLNEDKTILFTLISAEGGVKLSDTNLNTTVIIINDDITPPHLLTSVTALDDFGFVFNGNISDSKSYTVSGTGLSSDVSVSVTDNFLVSLNNLDFSNSIDIPFANANSGPVDVFVRFLPATGTDQEITGIITHSSAGAENITITTGGTESGNAAGDLLLNENFDYGPETETLTTISPWENYSGTIFPIQYIVDGLSITGYGSSGTGGAITMENGDGSREDVRRIFSSQNSGTVYTAQMINVSNATASETGDFFLSLRDSGGKYFDRLYAKDDGSGNLLLGTARTRSGGGLEVYSSTTYSYNTTYLVVIKYDFSMGVTSMFVFDGSLPATEPAAPDVVANTGDEPVSFEDIIIRQSADDIAVTIDGIRITKTWSDALGL